MIELTVPQTEKLEKLLSGIPGAAPKAASRAINRALESAKAEAVRVVKQEYTVKAGDVRGKIKITKSSPDYLVGVAYCTGHVVPLSKFVINPNKPKYRSPVKTQVKGEGGMKLIRNKRIFVAKMHSGHIGVFRRKKDKPMKSNEKKEALEQIYGPSLPQMLGAKRVSDAVEGKALETLDKRLEHEIARVLEGS